MKIHINIKINKICLFIWLCCFIFYFCWNRAYAEVTPLKFSICFYSSESNINNFKSLKIEFDTYLSKLGHYEFQPFFEQDIFEKYITNEKHYIVIISSWHYQNIWKNFSLEALMTSVQNGNKYQKKIIVCMKDALDMQYWIKGSIASASSIKYSKILLHDMIGQQNDIYSGKILIVPKEIDALMSVGFGMTDAALISKNSFDMLKMINFSMYEKMNILAEGKKSLSLVLAVPNNCKNSANKIINIIKDMPSKENGYKKIKRLGIDSWGVLNLSDLSFLKGESCR